MNNTLKGKTIFIFLSGTLLGACTDCSVKGQAELRAVAGCTSGDAEGTKAQTSGKPLGTGAAARTVASTSGNALGTGAAKGTVGGAWEEYVVARKDWQIDSRHLTTMSNADSMKLAGMTVDIAMAEQKNGKILATGLRFIGKAKVEKAEITAQNKEVCQGVFVFRGDNSLFMANKLVFFITSDIKIFFTSDNKYFISRQS